MFDGAGNNATITAIWKHCLLGLNALGACVQFPMHLHRPTLIQVNVAFTINVMHFHYWEHPITFVAGLQAVLQAFLVSKRQVFLNRANSGMLRPR